MTARQLSYDCVGVTVRSELVPTAGFRAFERSVRVGTGEEGWRRAGQELFAWAVKTRSGFAVQDAGRDVAGRAEVGVDYWLAARLGPWRVREPVRVVAIVDEPDRIGYAYGTLEGHPISGEEAFLLSRRDDGSVWFTLRSITRAPTSGRWRVLFPAVLVAQRYYRRRYLKALVAN